MGLIYSTPPICEKCNNLMLFDKNKIRLGIKGQFRCPRPCRATLPLTVNSVFFDSKLEINKCLEIIYFYSEKKNMRETSIETEVSISTVNYWFHKLDDIVNSCQDGTINMFSASDEVFEVDECHLHINKYHRGRILQSQRWWVVGIYSRSSKKIKLILTQKRNTEVLAEFISTSIPSNKVIITDFWRGYNFLPYAGYHHLKINHKIHFVDDYNPEIHTNNIERTWRTLRESIPININYESATKKILNFEKEFNSTIKITSDRFEFVLEAIRNFNK